MSHAIGWMKLLVGYGEPGGDPFPIPAYSEFMPPPRLGRKPYGEPEVDLFAQDDPWGWRVSEVEEAWELAPGLEHIARELFATLLALGQGREEHLMRGHGGRNLDGNPYWPPELAAATGSLAHERFVALLPLALSRTQDDKGRVRWTLLGSSELGPERAFWRGFNREPDREDGSAAVGFLCHLLSVAYGEDASDVEALQARGLRVLGGGGHPRPEWGVEPLPRWAAPFLLSESGPFDAVRYLLTFRPFASLPEAVRGRYLRGELQLLPFPGSLAFWGMPTFLRLAEGLPQAMQLPLLRLTGRRRGAGIRVPQSGWLHEPGSEGLERQLHEAYLAEMFRRTHRWDRVRRHEDELAVLKREDRVARVLFSTDPEAMGLYDKPMARNAQLWTDDFRPLLDGPRATPEDIERARERVLAGGTFGYRFVYPAMRVGRYEVTWHRPLVAFVKPGESVPTLLPDGPPGVLAAASADHPSSVPELELFPRLLQRPLESAAVSLRGTMDHAGRFAAENILALAAAWGALGERPLPRSFARRLLKARKDESLEQWMDALRNSIPEARVAKEVRGGITELLAPAERGAEDGEKPLTFEQTATRAFEEGWWRDVAWLAHDGYLTKDNADCALDPVTQAHLPHPWRDLDPLAERLIERHRAAIASAGLTGKAWCGELPFSWRTDFPFSLFGGWVANQEGTAHERDVIVVIPGKEHRQAVVLADHFDTAYMEDVYDTGRGGSGARLAAHGADDNCSATATLLQAAPVFLDLARRGRLQRDVWLVHLTGEEFPSDCMGARALCGALMERALVLRVEDGRTVDLSATRVVGVVVMDMIAHNRASNPYVFQISPGDGPGPLRVALEAHLANEAWNRGADRWNAGSERRGRGPSRSADPATIPPVAEFPHLRGEVRLHFQSRSSLYNTDGQIFSDVGVPVVLFMEDYDIDRQGYHDTHDTIANIDLDYGAGVAAIAIETVARLAVEKGHRA